MRAGQARGAVLGAWIRHAGVEGNEFAARLPTPVSRQAVTNWKSGVRAPAKATAEDLAAAMGANSFERAALVDMWRAAGSVDDGMPRLQWAHNFAVTGGPVWIWIRLQDPTRPLHASLWWGEPFQGEIRRDVPAMGIVVTSPISIPNPPVEVLLDSPGWVDFGTGVIPKEVAVLLGVELCDGRTLLGTVAPNRAALDPSSSAALATLFSSLRSIANKFGIAWSVLVPHLGIARPLPVPLEIAGRMAQVAELADAMSISGVQLQRLRKARGLSRGAAARAINELDAAHPVTDSAVETAELAETFRHSPMLLARLDHVYAADGHVGVQQTFTEPPNPRADIRKVKFPPYWVGPVWVQAIAPNKDEVGVVDLVWGLWRRQQRVPSGAVLTTRRSSTISPALHVRAPRGWRVIAGTGLPPGSTDVGRNWWPASIAAAASLLRDNLRIATSTEPSGNTELAK